ncbi:MAG: hypothetical protein JWM49_2031 [Microbacteriaceae bacterium]|nr:hypothetical protein [Microbacteriaceae bacterium]
MPRQTVLVHPGNGYKVVVLDVRAVRKTRINGAYLDEENDDGLLFNVRPQDHDEVVRRVEEGFAESSEGEDVDTEDSVLGAMKVTYPGRERFWVVPPGPERYSQITVRPKTF